MQHGCTGDRKCYRHPAAEQAEKPACLSNLMKAISQKVRVPKSFVYQKCPPLQHFGFAATAGNHSARWRGTRRAPRASRLSPSLLPCNQLPDASLEVFSISSDSINVMFFHKLSYSSALLHTLATCLHWAHEAGRPPACQGPKLLLTPAAMSDLHYYSIIQTRVFFPARQITFSASLLLTLRKQQQTTEANYSHVVHGSVLKIVRMLLKLPTQLQQAAAGPGGVFLAVNLPTHCSEA